ncbi:hypothetical protein BBU118A_E05 (plasmid) [Borreliella burgdorferi 118a]|uniref:Uncharacterized protein n=1 Tax=Borreliella burgdorferi 118a TaxID=476210 RepID=A0A7U4DIW2_BORBG|nr:hypothetical protein BBU118A_E05 [Borreliella burgdorferi 118a]
MSISLRFLKMKLTIGLDMANTFSSSKRIFILELENFNKN